MLDLAFAYSNVRFWSFEDTHRPELAILTIKADFAGEIDTDWSTLEHNVTAECQDDVKHTFRQSLDENALFEIEVPFFFDNVYWLLFRDFPVEETGKRKLIGIHVDLTAIREAVTELKQQKSSGRRSRTCRDLRID
jgi:hypothetical protein